MFLVVFGRLLSVIAVCKVTNHFFYCGSLSGLFPPWLNVFVLLCSFFFPRRGRGRWYQSCRLFCHSFVPRYCQTGRFAFPNGPFQVLKRAVSDCKMACFVTRWMSVFCAASFALLSFAPFPLAPAAGIVPVNGAAVSLRLGPCQSPAPCASSGDRPICWCQWA